MKALLLCAGYGTRLYPLTINTPKALLKVQGKTLLELLIDNLQEIDAIDEIVIISNDRFYKNFCDFKPQIASTKKITILNDGTTSNDNRRGAIGDIKFALDKIKYHGEIMVLAGDNWFDFKLKDLYNFYLKNPALYQYDFDERGFQWISGEDHQQSIISFRRKSKEQGELIVVCNFVPVRRDNYRIGVPEAGTYKTVFCSDWEEFGGHTEKNLKGKRSDGIPMHGEENSIELTIPGMSVTVYKKYTRKVKIYEYFDEG